MPSDFTRPLTSKRMEFLGNFMGESGQVGEAQGGQSGRDAWDLGGKAFLVATLVGPLYFITRAVSDRDAFVFMGQPVVKALGASWFVWATGLVALVAAAYWLAETVNHRLAGGRTNWREGAILVATQSAFWFLTSLNDLDVSQLRSNPVAEALERRVRRAHEHMA